ncbi:lipopolysaccharide heptosyltransferase II [bacterium endosymbiont of Escarpia laminata]|nr:MAG: lipopolysaccharide heptosyltransferase II [bacterium endosymbiont of Escarpia laminata]
MGSAHFPSARLLVVGPSWAGDMVMAQSLFRALKQRSPSVAIDVLAPAWSRPLLSRMPEVDEAIDMPVGHGRLGLMDRWRLGRLLRGRYGQAILLPNSLKSALVPFFARIPQRTGWLGEMRYGLLNDFRKLDKQHLTMTVQRFVALAFPADESALPEIPPPALKVRVADVQQAMSDLGLQKGPRPLLALCPGAEFGPSKRWPEGNYGELARQRIESGWDVWLFGSEKDQPVCETVNRVAQGRCVDLSGRTSLAQAVDLLSLADAVVSNDSGLMHVAAALNRRLVAVYGSTDPGFTPPLNRGSQIVRLGLDCSPCFKRECPLGHLDCLRKMPVEMVSKALDGLPQ